MASEIAAALEAADISVSGHLLLRNISLELRSGTLTAICGPSGSGKSRLLRAFWGAQRLARGKIFCDSLDMTHAAPRRWAAWRRQVGIFCDDFPLGDDWTVAANIAAALYTTEKLPEKIIARRVNATLRRWGLLPQRRLAARMLSGSERTRLALARAFIRRPPVALLDDPLRSVPPVERDHLLNIIQGEARAGTAICLAADRESAAAAGIIEYIIEDEQLRPGENKIPLELRG